MPGRPPSARRRFSASPSSQSKKPVLDEIARRAGDVRVIVERERFVLGRSAREAQLPLRDGNVSRQHGVLLNGARVTRVPLRVSDVLEIGTFVIRVERA